MKKHYKMYKSGKKWCYTALVTIAASSFLLCSTSKVNADNSAGTVITSQESSGISQNQGSQQLKDNGNYGWLDSANIVNNDSIAASGWQATNQAENKPYRYLIVYDQTSNSELGRQQIQNSVRRPDVAKAYPQVGNAINAGYNTTVNHLNWQKVNSVNDNINIVSRYSDNPQGEGNHVDTWSRSINLDKQNYACLDNFSISNNQLNVSGWNATNQSLGKNYHYIILFDQTLNREITRKEVGSPRPDVAKVYPQVVNAGNSGFNIEFPLTNLNLGHTYQIISRYSDKPNGEGQYVDFWFAPKSFSPSNKSNNGHLDGVNLSTGSLEVSGWHATDYSMIETNHYLILFDRTANKQVSSIKVSQIARPDVQNAYQSVKTAQQSGFSGNFGKVQLNPYHNYSLVSRYSTYNGGNGDNGNSMYTDYWFTLPTNNQSKDYLDGYDFNNDKLHIHGWMASSDSLVKPYKYAIILYNGREITRQKLNLNSRKDVGVAFPRILNSENSGYDTTIDLPLTELNGNITLILRFTNDPNGNGNFEDFSHLLKLPINITPSNPQASPSDEHNFPETHKYTWEVKYEDEYGEQLTTPVFIKDTYKPGDKYNATTNPITNKQQFNGDGVIYTLNLKKSSNVFGNFGNNDETTILVYDERNIPGQGHDGEPSKPQNPVANLDDALKLPQVWINAVRHFMINRLTLHPEERITEISSSSSDKEETKLAHVLGEQGETILEQNSYISDPNLANERVKMDSNGQLNRDAQIELTRYTAKLLNSIRNQLGTPQYQITEQALSDSSNMAKAWSEHSLFGDELQNVRAANHQVGDIRSLDDNWHGEKVDVNTGITVDDLHHAVFNLVMDRMANGFSDEDWDWSDFVKLTGIDKNFADIYLGVQVDKLGFIHINGNDDKTPNQGQIFSVPTDNGWINWYKITEDDSPRIPVI